MLFAAVKGDIDVPSRLQSLANQKLKELKHSNSLISESYKNVTLGCDSCVAFLSPEDRSPLALISPPSDAFLQLMVGHYVDLACDKA